MGPPRKMLLICYRLRSLYLLAGPDLRIQDVQAPEFGVRQVATLMGLQQFGLLHAGRIECHLATHQGLVAENPHLTFSNRDESPVNRQGLTTPIRA